ncbi:MAG: hypothetical protein ACD_3C00045G0004, partial [uncultured bacterium (gcode 4)]
ISWNYNWVMLKVFTWSTYYFVPTPTLFWIWTWSTVYDNTFWSWKDLLPWVNNAAVFDSSKVYATWSDSLWGTDITNLMTTVKAAYSTWNVTTPAVQAIVAASWAELINIWEGLVKNSLWGGIKDNWNWNEQAISPNWNSSGNAWTSCLNIKTAYPSSADWIYWINPDSTTPIQAYCDMTTDSWGWTLIVNIKKNNAPPADWNTRTTWFDFWWDRTKTYRLSDSAINALRLWWTSVYRNRASTNNTFYYTLASNPFTSNIWNYPSATWLCTNLGLTNDCRNLYYDSNSSPYTLYAYSWSPQQWDHPWTFAMAGSTWAPTCANKPWLWWLWASYWCDSWTWNSDSTWAEWWMR